MPEDTKKHQDKKKNDPKEQRKPRNSRNQVNKGDKKIEEPKSTSKVTVPQKPPVYEDPGPEFYKNLKRETEEILKITEEENSKYKKKEIQSNWAKYEMPIESYDDIEEHDIGADYEKLIQAPLTVGAHFQFKHEKSWDVNTAPSLYDKYFEINMDNLSLAMSTIPFYDRNDLDKSLFSETDMLTMDNRATKYKQKYYGDKSYSTSETEAQEKILNSLSKNINTTEDTVSIEEAEATKKLENRSDATDIDFIFQKTDIPINSLTVKENATKSSENNVGSIKSLDVIEDLVIEDTLKTNQDIITSKEIEPQIDIIKERSKEDQEPVAIATKYNAVADLKDKTVETKNSIIESPEDLEKWLDDFLDG